MIYDGKGFRLVDLLQADLVPGSEFQQVSRTDKADIEFSGRLDVYRRAKDAEAIYTLSKGSGTGEQAIPNLWLRWIAEQSVEVEARDSSREKRSCLSGLFLAAAHSAVSGRRVNPPRCSGFTLTVTPDFACCLVL